MNKTLKVLDEMEEIRQKAAEKPQEYNTDYVIRVCCAIVAKAYGYESRTDWTDALKKEPQSQYYKRYNGIEGIFHV